MRISFSGTANTGKTTLITNFLHVWPQYKTPARTYRDLIKEKNYSHSSQSTPETQLDVLSFMIGQLAEFPVGSKVIHDRCPLDNLAYTLWCHEKGIEGFDKQFVDTSIALARESMKNLDIIFLLSYDDSIKIEADGLRETNKEYILEIDNIFKVLYDQYSQNLSADIFFPKDDSPCVIPLPASPQQRIDLISEYISPQGELYGEEESIFNPEKLNELEVLVKQQSLALEAERRERELYNKFKIN